MKRLLNWLLKKTHLPATDYPVKYAFTSGGVEYFQLEDFNNTPALRGLKTMVFYEEMKMKCTLDFLQLHTDAVNALLLKDRINVFEIKKLNDQLKQRLDMALDMELVMKLASVVFFPRNENIKDYDFDFNRRKIEGWKRHEAEDFFLLRPLQEFLPVLKDLNVNLKNYIAVAEKLNKHHLDTLLRLLPENKTTKLKGKSYFSAVVMPQKSRPFEA